MSKDSESFLPFIFKVINDIYTRINEIGTSMEQMNQRMEDFTYKITDRIVNLSEGISGIIQIIKANREASFNYFSNAINELKVDFKSIREKSDELGPLQGQLIQEMGNAKKYLQNKIWDAEFLALVFELKDLSNELRSLKLKTS
jgi:methyl-accepting chemotaxis protein